MARTLIRAGWRARSFVLEGAYLDRVGPGGRMGGGELDRLFLAGAADHVDRGDVLAGGEERAVSQHGFPVADAERGDGIGSLEGSAQDVQAAGGYVLPPGVSLRQDRLVDRWRRLRPARPDRQRVGAGGAVLEAAERGRLLVQPRLAGERAVLVRYDPGH